MLRLFTIAIGLGLFATASLSYAVIQTPGRDCSSAWRTLSQSVARAQAKGLSLAERPGAMQSFFGKNGFLRSMMYARAVANIYVHSDKTVIKTVSELSATGRLSHKRFADLPGGIFLETRNYYDEAIAKAPWEATDAVYRALDHDFASSHLETQGNTAVVTSRAKAIKLRAAQYFTSPKNFLEACRFFAEVRSNPQLQSVFLNVMAETLPQQGPSLLRRSVSKGHSRNGNGAWMALDDRIMASLTSSGLSALFAGLAGTPAAVFPFVVVAPTVANKVYWSARALPSKLGAVRRGFAFSRWLKQEAPTASLAAPLPEPSPVVPVVALPAPEKKPRFSLPFLAPRESLGITETVSPLVTTYESRSEVFKALPTKDAGAVHEFGTQTQSELTRFAQELLLQQQRAFHPARWENLAQTAGKVAKYAGKRNFSEKEGAAALLSAIDGKLRALVPYLEIFRAMRSDGSVLNDALDTLVGTARARQAELLLLVDSETPHPEADLELTLMRGRLKALEQWQQSLSLLRQAVEKSETSLLTTRHLLENTQQTLTMTAILPAGSLRTVSVGTEAKRLQRSLQEQSKGR